MIDSRVKEVNKSNQGELMTIIKNIDKSSVIVEFNDIKKTKIKGRYSDFKSGSVKNPNKPSVYKTGYFGIGEYKSINEDKVQTKCYDSWKGLLRRCYSEKEKNKWITYKDCAVHEGWHNFQNFAKWYEDNYYEIENERMELDKDILVKGNKVYSPETCIFVPKNINVLFTKNNIIRGEYPIGCYKSGNKIKSQLSYYDFNEHKNKRLYIGKFDNSDDAFNGYKLAKENYIKEVANIYKDRIPEKLYKAMITYEVEITD